MNRTKYTNQARECAAGPLPKFEGLTAPLGSQAPPPPATIPAQSSGGPIRVPPLIPEKVNEYYSLFERSGSVNGMLSGWSPMGGGYFVKQAPLTRF